MSALSTVAIVCWPDEFDIAIIEELIRKLTLAPQGVHTIVCAIKESPRV
jgi:hypothetical protein